ncbi:MAG: matrixin family metalloprotease [Paludibaculum sp.]
MSCRNTALRGSIRNRRFTLAPVTVLCLLLAVHLSAAERPGSWTGPYRPCDNHDDVLKQEPVNLGIRFATSNPALKTEFAHAMNFWASILQLDWHEEDSRACAIQVVDGGPSLFRAGQVARAQFPGLPEYQGWIAFNPRVTSSPNELFVTAVHELGHILGLPHSANASSVMYFLALDGPVFLDTADLAVLSAKHRLREVITTGSAPKSSLQAWRRAAL